MLAPPTWMAYHFIMDNSMKMDDLGGNPIVENSICLVVVVLANAKKIMKETAMLYIV